MMTKNNRPFVLAAAAAALLATQTARADTYTDGDLILGFRAGGGAGGTTNLLLNLGSASIFRDATTQFTLSLGALDADLDSLFSAVWDTRSDFFWSVAGTQYTAGNGFANRTLIASRSQAFPLGPIGSANSTPWARGTTSTQSIPAGKLAALGTKFGLGTTGAVSGTDQIESTNAPFGLIQPQAQTNSLDEFMTGGSQSSFGSSFAYFSGGIEGGFGNGASGTALDLYVMTAGTGGGPGTYEGSFTIASGGDVTFTPEGVPEPSSALMLALGGTALGFIRRRQRA